METEIKLFLSKRIKKEKKINLKNNIIKLIIIKNINLKIFVITLVLFIINICIMFYLKIYFIKSNDEIKYNSKYNYIGNYSLYNYFRIPQISIVIINLNGSQYNKILNNFISGLKNQTLRDIQVIFCFHREKNKNITLKNLKAPFMDEIIKILIKNKISRIDFLNLIHKIKGKFTIFLENNIKFENEELKNFYIYTQGKIDNAFKFKTKKGNVVYLIRSRILKDLIERLKTFKNINEIIKNIISASYPKLNYISIALCPDNYYTPLTYVAMMSILDTKVYYTYISFYLIIPKNFTQSNINLLESLYKQYDYFNITFLRMDKRYDKAFINRYLTKQTYYRCSLGELIPYLDRVIYLDSDILVFRDLTSFYNLNFKGKMILGQLSSINKSKQTGIYNINMGVLLLNLKYMRKIKMEKKVLNIINKGFKSNYHDQYLINHYFSKQIGNLPPEYNTRPFNSFEDIIKYNNKSGNLYDNYYLYFCWKYPIIRHYLGYLKPINPKANDIDDWWFFARKSRYFNTVTKNMSNIFKFIKN